MMIICNELTRLGRKNASGEVKWFCSFISHVLRNATYKGYICYNKSKTTNYLDKKRIKNLDDSSVITIKGNFEPIISEEQWAICERIREAKVIQYNSPKGESRKIGFRGINHLWVDKLRCRCGSGYTRYTWRKLKDGTPVYGYQCAFRTCNVAKSYVERHDLKKVKTCDAISICEWKLELMAKKIFGLIWGDQKEAVLKACRMIELCTAQSERANQEHANANELKLEKLKQRKLRYSQMFADGDLNRDEYKELCRQTENEIQSLQSAPTKVMIPQASQVKNMGEIKKALEKLIDIDGPKISDELVDEFIEVVTPVENNHYRWKMNFGKKKSHADRADLMGIQGQPIISFTIDFEEAKKYRQDNHLPTQFRQRDWTDLQVDVYL